ncbi:hypothetical protein [Pseudonocardia hierapolitana]|uniref:hypothetical protein n=1 Tax=Pseudonocardia hierapolitana TaxID=1128676 RepID=UPI0011BFE2D5|nr:hypothetical protein [Pseudonocardia hierapolitana]
MAVPLGGREVELARTRAALAEAGALADWERAQRRQLLHWPPATEEPAHLPHDVTEILLIAQLPASHTKGPESHLDPSRSTTMRRYSACLNASRVVTGGDRPSRRRFVGGQLLALARGSAVVKDLVRTGYGAHRGGSK